MGCRKGYLCQPQNGVMFLKLLGILSKIGKDRPSSLWFRGGVPFRCFNWQVNKTDKLGEGLGAKGGNAIGRYAKGLRHCP